MSEKPILFSSSMVKAILEDRKTMSRRVVKPQPVVREGGCPAWSREDGKRIPNGPRRAFGGAKVAMNDLIVEYCPHGQIGSRLWVRETFSHSTDSTGKACVIYKADGQGRGAFYTDNGNGDFSHIGETVTPLLDDLSGVRWRPSIFMPRNASRITLEITNVRVERLQDISEADATAEGITCSFDGKTFTPSGHEFIQTWNKINSKRGYPWESNPWCWVLTFKRVI